MQNPAPCRVARLRQGVCGREGNESAENRGQGPGQQVQARVAEMHTTGESKMHTRGETQTATPTIHFGTGGDTHFEVLQCAASDGLAYWVGLQHSSVRMADSNRPRHVVLRVTELFRREKGE